MINSGHKFHIPVLGVGFSVDSPVKVSRYGISSAISLVDDTLMEKLRKYYSAKLNRPYEPISSKDYDSRASRITAYLNMINRIVKDQFEALKNSAFS
jgi:intergrase/recombinase